MPLSGQQRLALRQRLYPQADERVFGTVERALDRYMQPDACVLDAGSGTGTWVLDRHAASVRLLVGADIEPPVRRSLAAPVLADLSTLPFADASFSVVLCYNVMEHLADPQRTCREFARLLASGGVLIVKTPNLSAPVTGLANSLPLGLRRRLKGGLGVGGEHVFATYYRCNTPASVDQAMRGAGLQRDVLLVVDQTYDYLFFSHLTYALGLLYSRWLASNRLRRLGNSIVAVYRKPEYA